MSETRFDDMEQLAQAGTVVGLIGGLLALVPALEQLSVGAPGWGRPIAMLLLVGTILLGIGMAVRDWTALGGVLTGASGLVLAVIGPTGAGALALIGGTLIWVAAGKQRAEDETPPQVEARSAEIEASS